MDLETYSNTPLCQVSTQCTSQFLNCSIVLACLPPTLVLDFLNSSDLPCAWEGLGNQQAFAKQISEYPFSV